MPKSSLQAASVHGTRLPELSSNQIALFSLAFSPLPFSTTHRITAANPRWPVEDKVRADVPGRYISCSGQTADTHIGLLSLQSELKPTAKMNAKLAVSELGSHRLHHMHLT